MNFNIWSKNRNFNVSRPISRFRKPDFLFFSFFTLLKNWNVFQLIQVFYPKNNNYPTFKTYTDFRTKMDNLVTQFAELRIAAAQPTPKPLPPPPRRCRRLRAHIARRNWGRKMDNLIAQFAELRISRQRHNVTTSQRHNITTSQHHNVTTSQRHNVTTSQHENPIVARIMQLGV